MSDKQTEAYLAARDALRRIRITSSLLTPCTGTLDRSVYVSKPAAPPRTELRSR